MNAPTGGNARIDVAYVAHLARLRLTDEEVARFEGQLAQVVEYFQTLAALNVRDIEPTSHAHPVQNVFRADAVGLSLDRDTVMRNAPECRDGQFMVPKIVE